MDHPRPFCLVCRKPQVTCFCENLRPFEAEALFVILMHPKELKIRVNSGRMAHLCIKNSILLDGISFDEHPKVNGLINDPTKQCLLLYPGDDATSIPNLSRSLDTRQQVFFILDATWLLAKKMYHVSKNLQMLPKVEITPSTPSRFQIKKQPSKGFLSTIESIYHVIEASHKGCEPGPHQNLLEVFDLMVQKQVEYANTYRNIRRLCRTNPKT